MKTHLFNGLALAAAAFILTSCDDPYGEDGRYGGTTYDNKKNRFGHGSNNPGQQPPGTPGNPGTPGTPIEPGTTGTTATTDGGTATTPGTDPPPSIGDSGTPGNAGGTTGPPAGGYPYGIPVQGKDGFVYSPYKKDKQADVRGIAPGTEVECPYTQKIFLVP